MYVVVFGYWVVISGVWELFLEGWEFGKGWCYIGQWYIYEDIEKLLLQIW